MKKKYFIVFLFFVFNSLFSFSLNVDSLKKVIDKMPDDTAKVNCMINFLNNIYFSHPKEAKEYSYKLTLLSKKMNYPLGEANGYNALLTVYYLSEKYDSCSFYINKIIALENKVNNISFWAEAYNNMAGVYVELNKPEDAMRFYIKSMDYCLKKNDSTNYYVTKSNISRLLRLKKQFIEEEKTLLEALSYFKRNNQTGNAAYILSYLGRNQLNQGKYNDAENYVLKSIELALQIKDTILLNGSYSDMSSIYLNLDKNEEAIKYALKDLQYNKANKKYCFLSVDYLNLAKGFINMGKYSNALSHLDSGLFYNTTYCNEVLNTKMGIYENYTVVYDKLKQYEKAFLYHKKYKEVSDSINSSMNSESINELQAKYFTSEKENRIKLLEKDRILSKTEIEAEKKSKTFIIVIAIFILAITFLLFNRYRTKQNLEFKNQKNIADKNRAEMERELIEIEQKLLLIQMNPHFIFNSLNSIRIFIAQNEGFKASEYLADFAKLMRLILESSKKKFIPLEDEIKILEYYLKLEQVRYNHKFTYEIKIDENINDDIDSLKIPPMLLQPFIESAIQAGISDMEKEGIISINFYNLQEKTFEIEIKDNVAIRIKNLKENNKYTVKQESIALKITQERIKHFEKEFSSPIIYKIIDSEDGTKVNFIIPILD